MAAPTYVGMTAIQSNETDNTGVFNIDVPLPAGLQDGDILYLAVHRSTKATQSPAAPFSISSDPGWITVINTNGGTLDSMAAGVFIKRYSAGQAEPVNVSDANTSGAGNDAPLLGFMAAYRGVDPVSAGVGGTVAGNAGGRDWNVAFGVNPTPNDEMLCIGWMSRAGTNTYTITGPGLSSFNVRYNAGGSFGGTNVYFGLYDGVLLTAGDPGNIDYSRNGGGGGADMFHVPIALRPPQPLPPARTTLCT